MLLVAAIDSRLFQIDDLRGIAVRAANFLILPAHGNHELTAVLIVGEELDGFLECLWAFRDTTIAEFAVSQVYYYRNRVSSAKNPQILCDF